MDRRNFIHSSCLVCLGSIGAASFLESCTTSKHVTSFEKRGNKITIKKSEFTIASSTTMTNKNTATRKFILLKPEGVQFPIAVYAMNDGRYQSLYLQCTHQGCELNPYETTLVCPCHGAEFNTQGTVTQGPADMNLKTFFTTSDNENIYIQL